MSLFLGSQEGGRAMADRHGVQTTLVGPAQQLADIGVVREPQHGPMPAGQKDAKVGGVIGHRVGYKVRKTAWVFEGMVIVTVELLDHLIFSWMAIQ